MHGMLSQIAIFTFKTLPNDTIINERQPPNGVFLSGAGHWILNEMTIYISLRRLKCLLMWLMMFNYACPNAVK